MSNHLCRFQDYNCVMGDGKEFPRGQCIFKLFCKQIREQDKALQHLWEETGESGAYNLDTLIQLADMK